MSPSRPPDQPDQPALRTTAALLRAARAGDESAADVLFSRHRHRLQRWAKGRVPRQARDFLATDDLVQEALMKTLKHVRAFEQEHSGAFQGYLRKCVNNLIRDQVRRKRGAWQAQETAGKLEDLGPSPLEEIIGQETLGQYESALEGLKPGDRDMIVARVELGLEYEEIAREFDKPTVDAARMAVSRALLRLAEAMGMAR